MAPPVLQAIGPFDTELLAELHRQCFTAPWDRSWNAKSFADVLAMPGAAGSIILVDGAPQGFGITLQALDEVELLLIAILPQARGRGLGLLLLDSLLSAAVARGAKRALLEVADKNIPAIGAYTKVGFTICGRRKQYYPGRPMPFSSRKPCIRQVLMTKAINNAEICVRIANNKLGFIANVPGAGYVFHATFADRPRALIARHSTADPS